ncbi:hypothetical protein JHL21_09070 [Devosia sp. WQ 349]|uniref:hypothetical protein n=1 Tax=Devosia sp. WQ 349K1 TaxID=2800329 RepID=UPI0019083952|nr:hypothetical protein [Devosia sp. WQ 349K1]MBK1794654.1 hypothetical protein [Devosia sp. WQ 349K1]
MTIAVLADGDPVGAMCDLSGRGHHLLQTSSASRPVYKTNAGLHWLEGDGIDDFLVSTIVLNSYPFQLMAGFSMLAAADEGGIVALRKDNSAYKTLMQSSAGSYQLRATDRASLTLDARSNVSDAPQIATASFDAGFMSLAVNGVVKNTTTNTNTSGDMVDLRLFSFRDNDRWQGRIYAVALATGSVGPDVQVWLAARSGVTL